MLLKLLRSWSRAPAGEGERAPARDEPKREAERLAGYNWLVRGRHGIYVASDNDIYIGRALIHYGEFSELEWTLLRQYCRAGDAVVEVGANIGAHTVTLAKAVGPPGRVIAIEPQPVIFHNLCANLALNGLLNVDMHLCGCGRLDGTMGLPLLDYEAEQNFAAISLRPADDSRPSQPVPIRRLDDLVQQYRRIDLIKIDVEGMESDVLGGATKVIERFRPTLYVENDRVPQSKELIENLMGMGYRMWWHAPPLFNPDNYYRNAHNLYPSILSLNMLCLHRSAAAAPPQGLSEVTDSDYHPLMRAGPAHEG